MGAPQSGTHRTRFGAPALAAGALLTATGLLAAPLAAGTPARALTPGQHVVLRAAQATAAPDLRPGGTLAAGVLSGLPVTAPGSALVAPTPTSTPTPTPTPPTPTDPGPPPAGTTAGVDVSWPQCPVARGGYANPMPASWATLVVIGISQGSAFTTNPCLADEVAWARARHAWVAAYVLPTYPTNAEYARYGGHGPYPTRTVAGRLMNVGWAQAGYWIAAAKDAGLTTPMVWVDVEQKQKRLRWPARPADRNLPVLNGLLAGLKAAGKRTGVYTAASHWAQITGGVRTGLPEWSTVGPRTAALAAATCARPGVQGSPVVLAQYYTALPTGNTDYDLLCPSAHPETRLAWYFAHY